MAKRLLGKEVNEALVASLQNRTAALREKGIEPCLGIIRLGEKPPDLIFEKGSTKRAEEVGVFEFVSQQYNPNIYVVHLFAVCIYLFTSCSNLQM